MKKCPACNSTKYKEEIIDGKPVRVCGRCGFINKSEEGENKYEGQSSLKFN